MKKLKVARIKNKLMRIIADLFLAALFIHVAIYFHPNEFFSNAQYFTGPVSSGMGGAGVAAVNASEGAFLNPAVIAHAPRFESAIAYQDGYLARRTHRTQYGITLADNSANVVLPGAFSYFQGARTFSSGVSTEDQLWNLSLGNFVGRNFALGLNAYYMNHKIANAENESYWNGALGAHYTLSPKIAFAFVFYNPIDGPKDLPLELKPIPEIRFGLQYSPEAFVRLRLDVSRPERENPEKYGVIYSGVEVDMNQFAIFRLGGQFDDYRKQNYVTAGLGFNGPRLRINYSLQKNIKGTGGAVHGVDFRVPVW